MIAGCLRIGGTTSSIFAFIWLLLFAGCTGGPPLTLHTLSSGRQVRLISNGPMYFSQGEPSFVLSYQTDLKVNNLDALEKEVTEIWTDLQKEVDRRGFNNAIIMANEVPTGHSGGQPIQLRIPAQFGRHLAIKGQAERHALICP